MIDAPTLGGEASSTRAACTLARWADKKIDSKAKANDVFDRMCNAIRAGRFAEHEEHADLTFAAFADLYLKRYVELRGLRSRDHIERRLAILKERWKGKRLTEIRVGEIEDLIQDLRTKGASTTRLRSLLEWLRIGPDGQPKAPELPVFTRGDDEAVD